MEARLKCLGLALDEWQPARATRLATTGCAPVRAVGPAAGQKCDWVIVRPAATGLNPGQLVALAAAVGFAVSVVLVKSLTRTDTAIQVSYWMLVVQSVIGLVPALLVWQGPSAQAWGWVVVVAFCGTFSHYCFARAMQHADATVVVPMDFLRVPLTAGVGWAVYAERVDLFTAMGVALILGGGEPAEPAARTHGALIEHGPAPPPSE